MISNCLPTKKYFFRFRLNIINRYSIIKKKKKEGLPMYKFTLNETSYHGAGAINAIPNEIRSRAFTKAFVVTDPDLLKFAVTDKVLDVLKNADIEYAVFSDVSQY